MQTELQKKWLLLLDNLKKQEKAAVAFSGGVDSAFLLYAAKQALGEQTVAVTVQCEWVPMRETNESKRFCNDYEIPQYICQVGMHQISGFCENPPERCYLCKKVIFTKMKELAANLGNYVVLEGSNLDDLDDYRPGMRAIRELGVVSPLKDAGLTKEEIRILSGEYGLPTWKKPSFACLASRFVYGEKITEEKLNMVDRAEQKLMDSGFHQFRVRMHGELARIELLQEEMDRMLERTMQERINDYFKELGFTYVTLDLTGYRTGSMNEGII